MLVSALDGRAIEVRRRWLPWRLRKRKFNSGDLSLGVFDGVDDLGGLLFAVVFAIVVFLFGGIVLTVAIFASEALLLLLLLVPLFAAARMFWVLPWIIEATYEDQVLGMAKVRGWRDSEETIREIATAYQQGGDPFAAANRGG